MAMDQAQIQQLLASGQISPQELQQAFQDMEAYNTANTWLASQGGTNGMSLARDPTGAGIPMSARPNGIISNSSYNPYQSHLSGTQQNPLAVDPNISSRGNAATDRLASLGVIDRPKSASMWGEIGDFGKRFVLPAVAGYYGTQALGGMLGPGTTAGASGSTTLAGGAGADTLGAGGSTVFGGTAGGVATTSPFGGSAVGAPTVFGGSAGTTAVNPFAAVSPSSLSTGSAAGSGGAASGSGGMFSWLTADNVKKVGRALLGSGGIIPSIGEYFSSRDAANTMERGTDEAASRADPFAAERPMYMAALRQMMSNPETFAQDPSYQFRVNQGQQALERSNAARGYLGSGNMNQDLVKYGQDMGSQEYQNQYSRLAQLSGANTGSPATAGQTYGQGMQNVANQNQDTSSALWNAGRSIYDNWPTIQKTFSSSV